jgi:hypothetical protein
LATYLSEVADLFLSRVSDYKLDTIYQTSGSFVFGNYIEPYLLDSIQEFDVCDQVLDYTVSGSATDGVFSLDLTMENKIVLSQLMILSWLARDIQNIIQMNNHITDRDFKTFSASQNLTAKRDYYNLKREELSQRLVNYSFKKNNWADWRNQDFATQYE